MQQEAAKDLKGSQMYIEGRALLNCHVIVEMYTDKPKRARQLVQSVLRKFGYQSASLMSASYRISFHFIRLTPRPSRPNKASLASVYTSICPQKKGFLRLI